ncbi:MAG: hypothetical protein SFV54_24155 [Bryobacteraceae bacterium]|nr:hypothetical protein [Bryobacteraceae bacterium]
MSWFCNISKASRFALFAAVVLAPALAEGDRMAEPPARVAHLAPISAHVVELRAGAPRMQEADERDLVTLHRRMQAAFTRYRLQQPERPLRTFFSTGEAKALREAYQHALGAAYRNAGADPQYYVLESSGRNFRLK